MRTEAELRLRLKEAIQARRELLKEGRAAEKKKDSAAPEELAEEISNLSGVITTLEWVLESGAAPEYE